MAVWWVDMSVMTSRGLIDVAATPSQVFATIFSTDPALAFTPFFRISNSANHQLNPAAAFDGTRWLIVWQDDRNNAYKAGFASALMLCASASPGLTASTASASLAASWNRFVSM